MENAANALKMAGEFLIFVLAVSIIILAFGQTRESADIILDYRDRETAYINGNYYYGETGKTRVVNLETIVPAIFRAYLENYKIVFDGLNSPIYKIKNKNGIEIDKFVLDLETNQDKEYNNVVLGTDEQKAEFIRGVLYGDFDDNDVSAFQRKYRISLSGCVPIYEQLKNAVGRGYVIEEYLGVYYQNDNPNVPDVMKTEKRIITYKVRN